MAREYFWPTSYIVILICCAQTTVWNVRTFVSMTSALHHRQQHPYLRLTVRSASVPDSLLVRFRLHFRIIIIRIRNSVCHSRRTTAWRRVLRPWHRRCSRPSPPQPMRPRRRPAERPHLNCFWYLPSRAAVLAVEVKVTDTITTWCPCNVHLRLTWGIVTRWRVA